MNGTTSERITALLDAIKKKFPERKRAAEELMRKYGLDETLEMKIEDPTVCDFIPTFSTESKKVVSKALKARFSFAGSWQMGQEIWLNPEEMKAWVKDKSILENHEAKRENWTDSAPMLYTDEQLALFGITEEVPENAIYLVWPTVSEEPEVWVYVAYDSHKFSNLEEFLLWQLNRE